MAKTKAIPPIKFIVKARKELFTASLVLVKPMRKNEQRVVISQKKYIHTKLLDITRPNMADKNRNIKKKNQGLRSFCPSW